MSGRRHSRKTSASGRVRPNTACRRCHRSSPGSSCRTAGVGDGSEAPKGLDSSARNSSSVTNRPWNSEESGRRTSWSRRAVSTSNASARQISRRRPLPTMWASCLPIKANSNDSHEFSGVYSNHTPKRKVMSMILSCFLCLRVLSVSVRSRGPGARMSPGLQSTGSGQRLGPDVV